MFSSLSRRKFIKAASGFVAGVATTKSVALITTTATVNSVQAQTTPTPLILANGVAGAIGSAYIPASNQLVFVEYGGKISVIDLKNNIYTVLGSGYVQPEDIVVAGNGTVAYVTERIGTLLRVNLTPGSADRTNAVVITQGMIAPQQIAFDEAGNQAYTVEYASSSGRLLRIDLTNGQPTVLPVSLDQAVGLLIRPGTSVAYVSEQAGGGRLVQIDLNTGERNVLVNDLPAPFFLRWHDSSYTQILLPLRDPFNRVVRLNLTQVPVTTTLLLDGVPFRPSSVAVLPTNQLVVCSDSVVSAYTLAADSSLKLWPQLAAVKVLPGDAIVNAGTTVSVKGARGEGVSVQVVLSSSSKLEGLVPELTDITDPNGTTIADNAVQLYRVGYINVTQPSDPAGGTGEWPDALYPIGNDRYYGEPRNGAPFNLEAGRNQPIWIEIRIPRDAAAGVYTATFRVMQDGTAIAQLPLQLTVWNFTLPEKPTLPTTYKFNAYGAYCYHFFPNQPCGWNSAELDKLTELYKAEAAAHRITLDAPLDATVDYQYDDASSQLTILDWTSWDKGFRSEMTTYPLPGPNHFQWNDPNHFPWTEAQTREAVAFWRAAGQHYREKGWLERNFLYMFDEPFNPWPNTLGSSDEEKINKQWQLVAHQSNVLQQADPELRSLVTSSYNENLATNGQIDIWVPVVNSLDHAGFSAVYESEKANGKKIWWYDSNNSGLADHCKVDNPNDQDNRCEEPSDYGNWPDVFIDHQGVNQLVYGPLTWKYRLEGYLYYGTNENYQGSNNVWQQNYFLGRNGDGTLFYPGRPSDVGGTTHIPVSSIRLQLLRQSWTMYDFLVMLRDHGKESRADEIINTLVTSSDIWSHDANAYEGVRELLAAELTT